jgi:oligopeptide/dipeptide ABC transporter ATP-binding protein
MIAMALACSPRLLIADEATTALDVTIQAQVLELMKSLTERMGTAVLLITHNLGVVARYADRVEVMYAGKIRESAAADDLYSRPAHPYTRALLDSVPRMDRPMDQRMQTIRGEAPDPTMMPTGCSFRPRCDYAVTRCEAEDPALESVGGMHLSACWEADRVLNSGGTGAGTAR